MYHLEVKHIERAHRRQSRGNVYSLIALKYRSLPYLDSYTFHRSNLILGFNAFARDVIGVCHVRDGSLFHPFLEASVPDPVFHRSLRSLPPTTAPNRAPRPLHIFSRATFLSLRPTVCDVPSKHLRKELHSGSRYSGPSLSIKICPPVLSWLGGEWLFRLCLPGKKLAKGRADERSYYITPVRPHAKQRFETLLSIVLNVHKRATSKVVLRLICVDVTMLRTVIPPHFA